MVLLVSCNDIDEDLNLVLKCNSDDAASGSYRFDYAFYQNDSLYVIFLKGTDIYSLPIKCEDKRRKLNNKSERFVLSFDFFLKVFGGRNANDSLYFSLKRNDSTLWSCANSDFDRNVLTNPEFIINDSLVVLELYFLDKSCEDPDCDAVALVNTKCHYNLIALSSQSIYIHSPYKDKERILLSVNQGNKQKHALLFDKYGFIKKIPVLNHDYNYNSGSFYSDSVFLSVTGGYNDRNVKIQKYQIINDTLRFVEYLPYELYFDDYVNTVRDYIFPCGDDPCLYRYDKVKVEKIKYK
jgi:hypothetical protein